MTNESYSVNHILKKIGMVAAVLIILAAVFSSIFRSLTPWAEQYKPEVEQELSKVLDKTVQIKGMQTSWYWFQPVLKLSDVLIQEPNNESLHIDKLLIGINLFKSILHWKIEPGILYVENIHLVLREKKGHWTLEGLSTAGLKSSELTHEKADKVVAWLAQRERLILRRVSVDLHFNNGKLTLVDGINLSIVNSGGYYKIKGEARLEQNNKTAFKLLGDLHFDPEHIDQTSGHIYGSLQHLQPAEWQELISKNFPKIKSGKGSINLWIDFDKGAITTAQAQIKLKKLIWRLPGDKKTQLIDALYGNLACKQDKKGWTFLADHLSLRFGDFSWPENQLELRFDRAQNTYKLAVKELILESLFQLKVKWPQEVQNIVNIKPSGSLHDTQIMVKDKNISSFLTRFDRLGFNGTKNTPEVANLSGVLNWQPDNGRLELDSENSVLTLTGYPSQKLDLLNGAVEWKELSNGLRVSIERFVLSKKDLTLTLEGAVDQVTKDSLGQIRLDASFSGKNLEQWIAIIPAKYLKPKLNLWLKKDVKRIAEGTGTIKINGMAKDFPFDNNSGTFSIVSHLRGVDLFITSKWNIIKDIEGYLRLKSRNLDADVVHANINGIPVKQMSLKIDDIGKDKETLVVLGMIQGSVNKMMDFAMASPLKNKLSSLAMLSVKGQASLKLNVEAPLYPENDEVLVKGDLLFKNNEILVKHPAINLPLEDFSGDLSFDQNGITHSLLNANVFGYPLTINMQSVKKPKPYTTILVNGECTINSLKKRINSPVFSFLKGMFAFKALFKLTENPDDLDSVTVTSTLQGLAINLPAPLGKAHHSTLPVEVNMEFNSKKAILLKANYNNHLSMDLFFDEKKGEFDLKSGQINLGGSKAVDQKKPGLAIEGNLDGFDLQDWKKVITKLSTGPRNSYWLDKLRVINVTLGKLTFLNQEWNKLNVTAKVLPDHDWSFQLAQKNIDANLTYHPQTHALNGYIKRLKLAKIKTSTGSAAKANYRPEQIPNLNLRIDSLFIDSMQIGNITLKTHSDPGHFFIDYCRITSPLYQLQMTGDWLQDKGKDKTQMQVKLYLLHLAKSLKLWNITPAVDAKRGEMTFNGGWNNSIFNYSLAAVNGSMYLKLRNGIITHLSPETEEKLGLGKLLSILSLQTIPRRLQLDFSDLAHPGYSFDIFKGHFTIKNGVMNTQDSYIDGPVAYASMKGDLDLVSRIYDLDLSISPHITASLPVVATIAGGPVAGVAVWIVNKIISKGVNKITAYTYKVSGPWSQPVVQQLTIVKKKQNKK